MLVGWWCVVVVQGGCGGRDRVEWPNGPPYPSYSQERVNNVEVVGCCSSITELNCAIIKTDGMFTKINIFTAVSENIGMACLNMSACLSAILRICFQAVSAKELQVPLFFPGVLRMRSSWGRVDLIAMNGAVEKRVCGFYPDAKINVCTSMELFLS